jgi:hypothetical protein
VLSDLIPEWEARTLYNCGKGRKGFRRPLKTISKSSPKVWTQLEVENRIKEKLRLRQKIFKFVAA